MTPQSRLTIIPITLRAANDYVAQWHRHHPGTRGCKFSVGVQDETGTLRGVAIAGRPLARLLDDGFTLEANRVATDGCANACSALYGAVRRIAKEMGYARIITYILESETGVSLKAAGWVKVADVPGQSWSRPSRERIDKAPITGKERWEAALKPYMSIVQKEAA